MLCFDLCINKHIVTKEKEALEFSFLLLYSLTNEVRMISIAMNKRSHIIIQVFRKMATKDLWMKFNADKCVFYNESIKRKLIHYNAIVESALFLICAKYQKVPAFLLCTTILVKFMKWLGLFRVLHMHIYLLDIWIFLEINRLRLPT